MQLICWWRGILTKRLQFGLSRVARDSVAARTLWLCLLAALLEGADIVSMGLAAPQVRVVFGFSAAEIGVVLAAAIVGQVFGAVAGGWLGDRVGRKEVLIGSFVILGLFSLCTLWAQDLSEFLFVRLIAGIGIGGAFPNLIALASEAARPGKQATAIGLMYFGQPLGGAALALILAHEQSGFSWTSIFLIGGLGPLLIAPILLVALPSRNLSIRKSSTAPRWSVTELLSRQLAPTTVLLWVSFFCGLMVVYVINTWLPGLMVARGFTGSQAFLITGLENVGAAAGTLLLARLFDYGHRRALVICVYAATALSLFSLAVVGTLSAVILAAVLVGFFAIGGQLMLYAIAAQSYPAFMRATGLGAAVAVGRLGAIVGPVLVGAVLGAAHDSLGAVAVILPSIVVGGVAIFLLVTLRHARRLQCFPETAVEHEGMRNTVSPMVAD